MATISRRFDEGTRRGVRSIEMLGREYREARLSAGLSQAFVAVAARISRAHYSRIENALVRHLDIMVASRLAAVLGLDLSVRVFPGAEPLRDAPQQRLLDRLLHNAAAPLIVRREVPVNEQHSDQRAWDAVVSDGARGVAVELEMLVRDGQALERRMALKRRDGHVEGFLLVIADTVANRRVFRLHAELFADLPRVRRSIVIAALGAGSLPPTGLVFL